MFNKIISVIISRFFFEYETSTSVDGFKREIEKINFRKYLENSVDKTREELEEYIEKVKEECGPEDEEEKEEDRIKQSLWRYVDSNGETQYCKKILDEEEWRSWSKVPEEKKKKENKEDEEEENKND